MPNQSGKIVLVLILLLLFLGAAVYLFIPGFKEREYTEKAPGSSIQTVVYEGAGKSSGLTKDYYSKNLKISFKVPEDAKIEEKFTKLNINIANKWISVNFNGTNFENPKDHYNFLKQKNNLTPISYQEGTVDSYNYVLTTDEDVKDRNKISKAYFIYADYGIYIFSTSDEALYPVLDQIVQSFEYIPSDEDKP